MGGGALWRAWALINLWTVKLAAYMNKGGQSRLGAISSIYGKQNISFYEYCNKLTNRLQRQKERDRETERNEFKNSKHYYIQGKSRSFLCIIFTEVGLLSVSKHKIYILRHCGFHRDFIFCFNISISRPSFFFSSSIFSFSTFSFSVSATNFIISFCISLH